MFARPADTILDQMNTVPLQSQLAANPAVQSPHDLGHSGPKRQVRIYAKACRENRRCVLQELVRLNVILAGGVLQPGNKLLVA